VPPSAGWVAPTLAEKEALQGHLNALVVPSPGLTIDGDVGNRTIRAMIDYVKTTS